VQLDLSDDQQMVQETTRRFLETEFPLTKVRELAQDETGLDRAAIAQGAELGWFTFLVAESDGGGSISGEPVSDAAVIVEELGRAVFCGPVIPGNVVVDAISRSGNAAQKAAYLAALMTGQKLATWAFAEENDRWDLAGVAVSAEPSGDGIVLTGTKSFVQEAHAADVLLVSARTGDGFTQVLVPVGTPGVSISPLTALDLGRRFSEVSFDGVRLGTEAVLGQIGGAADTVARQADLATALVCAETIGSLDACYAMTLDYMHSRKAFGRPIGSFQALKHRLADMALWLETGKAVAVAAARAVDHDIDRADTVSVAKSYISDRGPAIVRDCLQLHGGIGYTWEFDLHLYLRRVESNAALYGSTVVHQDRLAAIVGF
jgi:alkylation response protein AidB-like acyl-CoA dehydrogenase